ncbi:helix-turn-helix domain-containing protein [Microvirga puerhi]|uniref:Helix-turn-helix transcriptional regulator n=1 Tax=Microvirga puerhi TaxID=2876078 RepID=A0ABS7VK81_9HYPH|nr:helix-turn-helix transcriptional regulator [Microvirga puerhi]MBZ6075943.1 helix-turn-helix transcriptional regulator [Microvirga puerhi]
MTTPASTVGDHLRDWRQRRRMSQMDLALEADISTRHLSFIETGRSQPSREMVLHLADRLEVPLRERNILLVAAGYAPVYSHRPFEDPALQAARQAIDLVLKGHEPYPALAVDRHWSLVAANGALMPLVGAVDPGLLKPPVNVLRLSLHPQGMASRIVNFPEWRDHILARLHHQVEVTADVTLMKLMDELRAYPPPSGTSRPPHPRQDYAGVLVPLRLRSEDGILTLFSTTTVFGTPIDVTLSELAIEAFFPADPETGALLQKAAARLP